MEEEDDKPFCFVEGTNIDKSAADDVLELHENVWYRLKPPKRAATMYDPFVSARQIDLIRNMIFGRTPLRVDPKPECFPRLEKCELPDRRDVLKKPCLKLRKSSVKFLNKSAYD